MYAMEIEDKLVHKFVYVYVCVHFRNYIMLLCGGHLFYKQRYNMYFKKNIITVYIYIWDYLKTITKHYVNIFFFKYILFSFRTL